MGSYVVELINVTKSYQLGETQVPALRGINLAVERGEFMAIVGPSGSGKTTLLNLISCLDEPTSGEVYVQNHNVGHLPDGEATKIRRDTIGFIFQSFNLIPVLNVMENVEFPLILQKRPAAERHRRVSEIVRSVGLDKHANHKPDQLSGGQRQRVAIARALATEPVIVLADEPTANLDSETGHAIIELMFEMNQEKNVTFIFSTHDPQVMNYATRRVVLRDGIIESDESVKDPGIFSPKAQAE